MPDPNPFAQFDERPKVNPFAQFVEPAPRKREFPSVGQHQEQIVKEALETMRGGRQEVSEGVTEDDFFKRSRGAARAAAGALRYLGSPIESSLRTVVGQPAQEYLGIPREYTEFAAGLAIPGVGISKVPAALRMREPPSVPPRLPLPKSATERTLADLEEDVALAATRPTGGVVPQAEAGAAVRRAAESYRPPEPPPQPVDEWITRAGPARTRAPTEEDWMRPSPRPTAADIDWIEKLPKKPPGERGPWGPTVAEGVPDPMSARARLISQGRAPDETVVAHLVDEARQGRHTALSHFRKITPAEDWAKVQGASLGYLGRTGELGGEIGWDAMTALRNYRGIPDREKGILFGQPVTVGGKQLQAGLRPHMDSMVKDMERIEKLAEAGAKGAAEAPMPLEAIVRVVGVSTDILLRAMGQPGAAASVAHWSRAYARWIEKGKTPAAIAGLAIATRNLQNTIGTAQAGPERKEVEVPRFEDPHTRSPVLAPDFAGILGTLARVRRQLPYEKMRQSDRVLDFSTASPPAANLADLTRGRFMPNEEYRRRMTGPTPLDQLNIDAGILDLLRGRR